MQTQSEGLKQFANLETYWRRFMKWCTLRSQMVVISNPNSQHM